MRHFILAAILLTTTATILAQDLPKNPDRGAKVGNAYALGDFETINTTNGNLMLNFPLGSLPSGRGNVGGSVSLVYNSKLWDMKSEKIEDFRGSPYPPYFDKSIIYQSDTGGWTMTPGVTTIEYENRSNEYNGITPSCPNGQGDTIGLLLTYTHKVRVILPDGSKHEMIPNGYADTPFINDGFYKVTHDGWIENCGGARSRTGNAMIYHSIDGTFLRLEYSYDNDENPSNNTWMLYMPDGSRFDGSHIYDRNGNSVSYDSTGVADQLDRSVSITTDINGDTLVNSKGVGGEDIVWTVKWKYIFPFKTYESCEIGRCTEDHFRNNVGGTMKVVDRIVQPEQLGVGEYIFSYNAPNYDPEAEIEESYGWGEISSIQLPSGATVNYEYVMDGEDGPEEFFLTPEILKNYPDTKTVNSDLEYDGSTTPTTETWSYNIENGISTVTSPDGGVTTDLFGTTDGGGLSLPWDSGLSFRTVEPNGTMVEKLWAMNHPANCSGCPAYRAVNTYVDAEFTSIKDVNGNYTLTAIKDYTFDKNGNITEVKEYDWIPYANISRTNGLITAVPTGISSYLKRISKTTYYNDTPEAASTTYTDPDSYHLASSKRLLRLPKSSEVQDGSATPVSRSEITYDYTNYDSSNTKAGNPTESKVWDSFKGGAVRAYSNPLTGTNSITTSATYNSYGMPLTSTDANGYVTQITYGNVAGPSGNVTDLYPTQTVSAYGTSLARTSTAVYDFYTGAVTTATDVDNNVSVVNEYDDLGRSTKVRTAAGTALESWTRTEYDDVARRVIVRGDLETVGDGKKVAVQHYDQLGRVRLSRSLALPNRQSEQLSAHVKPFPGRHGNRRHKRTNNGLDPLKKLEHRPPCRNRNILRLRPPRSVGQQLSLDWRSRY